MPASVNIPTRCKKQAQKITDEAFGGAAAPYRPPPLGYATDPIRPSTYALIGTFHTDLIIFSL